MELSEEWESRSDCDCKHQKHFIYILLHVPYMLPLIPVMRVEPILCSIEPFACLCLYLSVHDSLGTRGAPPF